MRSIKALYATDYARRCKTCRFCATPFSDVTKRNLQNTCSQQCDSAMMVASRRARGNYAQTEEQKEKKRVACKATYASRDVFGPELRRKFSETMKRTWEKTRTTGNSSVLGGFAVHHLRLPGRMVGPSHGRGGKRTDLGDLFSDHDGKRTLQEFSTFKDENGCTNQKFSSFKRRHTRQISGSQMKTRTLKSRVG